MDQVELFFLLGLLVQVAHSIEEMTTGFHRKWYLFAMPFWVFLLFEIIFLTFWTTVLLIPEFPARGNFQVGFLILMLANGIQHLVWAGIKKGYVPGLITAPLHVLVAGAFLVSVLLI